MMVIGNVRKTSSGGNGNWSSCCMQSTHELAYASPLDRTHPQLETDLQDRTNFRIGSDEPAWCPQFFYLKRPHLLPGKFN